MNFKFSLSETGTSSHIFLSISDYRFKEIHILTPLKISPDQWDEEKQRPQNIYLKNSKIINRIIDSIKVNFTNYIETFISQKKKITAKRLETLMQNEILLKNSAQLDGTLLYFASLYIESRKEIVCHSTFKRYNVFFRLLERFEGFTKNRIYVKDLNSNFIKDFNIFGNEEMYSKSTIYRTLNFIKTILNFAEKKGISTSIREFEYKRDKAETEIITLNDDELLLIEKTEVPTALQDAKDWLLISCYTGQRISDFMCFSADKLLEIENRLCINFVQKKTGKTILLPLHPAVIDIIRKSKNDFPTLINKELYNRNIKEIGKICKINNNIKAKKRIGHRVKELIVEKWEVLSSHIGRRSFSTNFYGKIPTPLLIGATGHSSEQMFLKYINRFDKDKIVSLSNHFNHIHSQYPAHIQLPHS
ncbi:MULTISPECIES: phage integrase SAM-like domain-containing protein [Chryseobacterium]|uniref:Integrase n=1 Tax=Chryseobacterium camelliae TaxID=1265445 RepID=A0ABU0TDV3_9FLAO|nr:MULTISPECIES: phage integrase SAM-like domain-containing protein [Chryseobacterium]MDT3406946.1 integrase [Pseudacidovorax intermedius]MDQ1095261.1 integrase [Chryseobacterium camelliae]MDQ1099199.1 integrase [Chryseobacterium sp. SORGH_AS_1048]MDR6086549.1 integrase [Chryseobacterium sp. SORGH_AS_0909]MDR6130919.1 integrase [Chryseobacterium sp. SORGH_AS_1175]